MSASRSSRRSWRITSTRPSSSGTSSESPTIGPRRCPNAPARTTRPRASEHRLVAISRRRSRSSLERSRCSRTMTAAAQNRCRTSWQRSYRPARSQRRRRPQLRWGSWLPSPRSFARGQGGPHVLTGPLIKEPGTESVEGFRHVASSAAEVFEAHGEKGNLASALAELAWSHWLTGDAGRMLELSERALTLAAEAADPLALRDAADSFGRALVLGRTSCADAVAKIDAVEPSSRRTGWSMPRSASTSPNSLG